MVGKSGCYINKISFCFIILSGLAVSVFSQERQISSLTNVYRQVISIGPAADKVLLNNVDSIAPGDTVLLIQMKGAIIYEVETSSYGSYRESLGVPGSSEFLIIQSVDIGTKSVTFTNDIFKSYNVAGSVQLIKVPSFNSVTVKADLTCQRWDSTRKTGGVLVMIVERNLNLDANIDVTGKGFTGGAISQGQGICLESNSALYDKFSYPDTYTNSGFKGESQAIKVFIDLSNTPSNYPAYAKGKGNNFTGGGGGNGRFSGGGGGSNYGIGGKGGREIATCIPSPGDGGIGGRQVKFTDLDGGIFLGSGGGSSTYENGSTASPGGQGGGIIIILCDTLKGKGKIIKADGATPDILASSNAGAGGGGGGGSIAIFQQSFSSQLTTSALTVSANGGKGGNNNGNFGEGGGGGGGLIMTNNVPTPGNVVKTVSGGTGGTRSGGSTAGTAGSAGESLTNFIPTLTGFLFNSIRSSITETQVDTVCSNMLPPKIIGTKPVGGTPPYTYLWEKSNDQVTWTTLINDADPVNYTPVSKETANVYFKRIVTDSSVPSPLIDISKPVLFVVQPQIKNNIIGNSDTLCFNGDPPLLHQLLPDLQVPNPNSIFYNWQDSSATRSWGSVKATSASFDPPAGLTITTWYRRTVTSGRCVDSTAKANMTVLPRIGNNLILNNPPDICYGMTFVNLTATDVPVLTGGDNSFRFKWESNINGAGWTSAPGVITGAGYNPVELPQRIPSNEYLYRRIVYSGNNNVCKDTSTSVLLRDFPGITNNIISGDQLIGHDSIPAPLTGLQPGNGSGSYLYVWLSRTRILPYDTAALIYNGRNYSPGPLTDTTWYRRVVNSSSCKDTSNTVVVNVHKAIINNALTSISGTVEDTICSGSVPGLIKGSVPAGGSRVQGTNDPGDYSFKWYSSISGGNPWNVITGATSQNYQPVALTQTTYFRREVGSPGISPLSRTLSNAFKITVLPLLSNSIAPADSVCYNTQPIPLQGIILSGGDNRYLFAWQDSTSVTGWSTITGGTSATYQPPVLTLPAKYRRIVYSGNNNCCVDTSNTVNIGIHQLPSGSIIGLADTTICEGSKIRLKLHLDGRKKWEVIYKENLSNGPVIKIASADTTIFASPVTSTALTTVTFSLGSVKDRYGCFATSLTGTRNADVYKVPVANAGRDTAICGPTYMLNPIPSVGTGTWYLPPEVVASTPNNSSVTITIDSTFTGKNVAYKFFWEEINWQCRNKDSVTVTFDKRVKSINAGRDTTIFSFDNTIQMTADPVKSWETGKWSVVTGNGDFNDNTNNLAIVKNLSQGINTFLWRVSNDKCKLEDLVTINVHKEFIPRAFSPNNDAFNNTFIITGLDLVNQISELKIVNGAGTEVFSTTNRDGQKWTNWDGKDSKGLELPEGTYYYLLKVTSKGTGHVFRRSGFIVLKRN